MVQFKGLKWEKSTPCRPVDNLLSTDFPKFIPHNWKFMEGKPKMSLVLANEYQRLWISERDALHKKMYPENETVNVDVVKKYILNFKKNTKKPPAGDPKKPFKMKKFQKINSLTSNSRSPDDKAMGYLKKQKPKNKENPKNSKKK